MHRPFLGNWYDLIGNNGVNSMKHFGILLDIGPEVNIEPIRVCKAQAPGTRQVQRLGIDDKNKMPTSAPHESEDIVWTARRLAEAVYKQFRDNITMSSLISALTHRSVLRNMQLSNMRVQSASVA